MTFLRHMTLMMWWWALVVVVLLLPKMLMSTKRCGFPMIQYHTLEPDDVICDDARVVVWFLAVLLAAAAAGRYHGRPLLSTRHQLC